MRLFTHQEFKDDRLKMENKAQEAARRLQGHIEDINALKTAHESLKAGLKADLDTFKADIARQKSHALSELSTIRSQISDYSVERDTWRDNLRIREAKISKIELELADRTKKLDSYAEKLSQKGSELDEKGRELAEKETHLSEKSKNVAKGEKLLENKSKKASLEIEKAQKVLDARKSKIDAAARQAAVEMAIIEGKERAITNRTEELKELEAQVIDRQKRLAVAFDEARKKGIY